jgi:CRP/FNR family cyclic AMP-dependent transcriptional regulator
MSALDVSTYVKKNPLFRGVPATALTKLARGAEEAYFAAGRFVFRQGGEALRLYLIREGKVSLEVAAPGKRAVTLQTLGPGEVLGWSWLMPPHAWNFDARATELTLAVALPAKDVRHLIEKDAEMGRLLTQRFLAIVVERLQATRLQLMDLYAKPGR